MAAIVAELLTIKPASAIGSAGLASAELLYCRLLWPGFSVQRVSRRRAQSLRITRIPDLQACTIDGQPNPGRTLRIQAGRR